MVQKNAVSWFDIPTLDIDRAAKFYETIFDINLTPLDLPDVQHVLDKVVAAGGET